MPRKSLISEVESGASNRRSFMQKVSLASAALAGTAIQGQAQMVSDADILNFALNLEYLEAEFYTVGTTGMTIEQMGIGVSGVGTPGPTTGGKKVTFSNTLVFSGTVAEELGRDERAHVQLIRGALSARGITPVAKPAINLNALGAGFNSQTEFTLVSRALEDVGVTAYGGAAPLIQDKQILGVAARILAAEAEHVGNVRLQVARLRVPTTKLDSVDILPPPSGSRFFSVDNNGLTAVRTPGQVLYLVYGSRANVSAGGFFPNGVNGPIRTSTGPA